MTVNGTSGAGSRRPRPLGVHSLDRFGLVVPDLEIARAFYGAFGLETATHGDVLRLRTIGNPQVWAELAEGPQKALRYLSFGACR